MAYFGQVSLKRRATLDPQLQEIVDKAIEFFDFNIVCGYRNKEDQNKEFAEGMSNKQWPNSKHNTLPSKAVDVAPMILGTNKIDWENYDRFIYLLCYMIGIAHTKGIKVRWGGDWNMNSLMDDQKLHDFPHLEIVED